MPDDTPLTEEELAAIEARAEATWPPPWRPEKLGEDSAVWSDVGAVAILAEEPVAVFIAHARTDIPRLAAEVRRRTRMAERLAQLLAWRVIDEDCGCPNGWADEHWAQRHCGGRLYRPGHPARDDLPDYCGVDYRAEKPEADRITQVAACWLAWAEDEAQKVPSLEEADDDD
ncbi:MAG: hypothetical protein C4551_02405 [Bacillota bacterium]|nr:MAG: hypothetical protein C4551_02405 [Bacillota bacterium]